LKKKVEPFPASLSTQILPFIPSTSSCATASPNPVPPNFPYISDCDIDAIEALYDGGNTSEVICES